MTTATTATRDDATTTTAAPTTPLAVQVLHPAFAFAHAILVGTPANTSSFDSIILQPEAAQPARLLWNAGTISEFISGQHGDCGPTATLGGLNWRDPKRWTLDRAGLAALDADEESHGFAEANGAQNIEHMDAYLTHIGVPHITVGYGQFVLSDFHAELKQHAGVLPIIVEWALAGNLPGDEPGVHFHYSTAVGMAANAAGYVWLDGDNRADDPGGRVRPPVLYTWANVVAAQPIAYIIILGPAGGPAPTPSPAPPSVWTRTPDKGAHDSANPQHHIGSGFADYALDPRHPLPDAYLNETYVYATLPNGKQIISFCPFTDGTLLIYDGHTVSAVEGMGHIMAWALTALGAAQASAKALTGKIAAALAALQ